MKLFDIDFSELSLRDVAELILEVSGRELARGEYIVTPNVDFVVRYKKDEYFKRVVDSAMLRLPDGMPIVWFSKLFGGKYSLTQRVTGADLLPMVCSMNRAYGRRIVFVGGDPGVSSQARDQINAEFPGAQVVDSYFPPYGFERSEKEREALASFLYRSRPDIVFFGVGSPKQEVYMYENLNNLYPSVYICCGAALDFASKLKKRAPRFVQYSGMEWLWRFFSDPRRLFKRYFLDDSYFCVIALRELFRQQR